ncbi:MAG: cytochrome c3 family protein [Desulfovibrionaceae bacterium]
MRICFALLAVLATAGLVWASQQPPQQPLKLSYFPDKVVEFGHTPHTGTLSLDCAACHHEKVDGEIVKCSTSGCHDVFDRRDRSEASFYNMVHGRGSAEVQSCLACHKDAARGKDRDEARRLTSCKGSACHP